LVEPCLRWLRETTVWRSPSRAVAEETLTTNLNNCRPKEEVELYEVWGASLAIVASLVEAATTREK
jgi:hypothetical protein